MASLREGLDKLMMTVRPKDRTITHPYCQLTAKKYGDLITKLKFQDRYANTILFEKYPWQTWEKEGITKSTYGLQYFLRIDGFRQMRVIINCQRLYNIFNNLEVYDKRLFDDNVVVPTVGYHLEEFIELVQKMTSEIVQDYIALRHEVFGNVVTPADLAVDTHQVEMVREGLGLHTSDLSETFRKHSRAETITVHHSQTNTHYMNTSARRQLKMYQKGVGIVRLEATFNERPKDLVWDWSGEPTQIADSLREEFDGLLKHMGIPLNWWKPRVMEKRKFVWALADAINLRSRRKTLRDGTVEPSKVMDGVLQGLLSQISWEMDPNNEDFKTLTRRLKRKGLLKHSGARGIYIPTDRLIFLKDIYARFCETEGWLC